MKNLESVDAEVLLMNLAVESWRLSRMLERSIDVSDIKVARRQSNQIRYFKRKLHENLAPLGIRLIDLDGELYDPGMAAAALNAADFDPDDILYVDQMMEPIVMGPDGVRRTGTMMLRK